MIRVFENLHVFKDLIRLLLKQSFDLSHFWSFVNSLHTKFAQNEFMLIILLYAIYIYRIPFLQKTQIDHVGSAYRRENKLQAVFFGCRKPSEPRGRVCFPGTVRRTILERKGLRGDLWRFMGLFEWNDMNI